MSEKIHEKINRKVQVWIASYAHTDTLQFLIFKLIDSRGGGWHPITGGVEKGESFLEAAKRETEEETQISPDSGAWFDLKHSHQFEGRWGKADEHAFGLLLKGDPVAIHLDPSEMTEFKWVTLDEVKREVGYEHQRSALEAFVCYLQSQHESAPSTR